MSDKKRKIAIIIAIALSVVIASIFTIISFLEKWSTFAPYLESAEIVIRGVTDDEINALTKADRRGDAIERMPQHDDSESWAFYLYIVGSDIESGNMNTLSELTRTLQANIKERNTEEKRIAERDKVLNFIDELHQKGMDLPSYLYLPTEIKDKKEPSGGESYYAGDAVKVINRIREVELPDRVTFVIQTGGANAWSDAEINPNRIERFVHDKDGFRKVESLPLSSMASPETLTAFLSYCEENYDADHKAVIFWNHGGGAFGYGLDEIYDKILSFKDMKKAFSDLYSDNPEHPPFEIIGFDACLNATIEAMNELSPYASYFIANEEVVMEDSWYYSDFVKDIANNPSMNALQVAKSIADCYINRYASLAVQDRPIFQAIDATISVVDLKESRDVYDAYVALMEKLLVDVLNDPSVLTTISKAGRSSMIFAMDSYDVINSLDLKSFMENLSPYYPEECSKVILEIEEAVKYARGTYYGADAGGIAVYFPLYVNELSSLKKFLTYINEITDENAIKALYYYKIAGCLNDELSQYALSLGLEEVKKLDLSALSSLVSLNPEVEGSAIKLDLERDQYPLLDHASLSLALIDDDTVIYLGQSGDVSLNENSMKGSFDGRWIMLENIALPLEYVNTIGNIIRYRSHVLYNGNDAYLTITYDSENDEVKIAGVNDNLSFDTSSEYISVERLKEVKAGDRIAPIYQASDLYDQGIFTYYLIEREVKLRENSLRYTTLNDGDYLITPTFYDVRGDEYYSPSVSLNIARGSIEEMYVDNSYVTVVID